MANANMNLNKGSESYMDINLQCMYCIIKKSDSLFNQFEKDEQEKLKFMKKVFSLVSNCEENETSPGLSSKIMRYLNEKFKKEDIYCEIKKDYNDLLVSMEDKIKQNIDKSEDRLMAALKYAMVGNFIDFGAMDKVDKNKLNELIENALKQEINMNEYYDFKKQLENCKNISYLCDNSGEIVFDKIFVETIKRLYKNINIDVIVRGKPVYNDATIVDAKEIGFLHKANVMGNGTDIPGTELNKINEKCKESINRADIIISKGQGNFETLFGCGKNIYYIFLCKCDLFTKRFNIERFKGIFINENNVEIK